MDKKELVVKPSDDQLALAKTNRLLAITNKILARQAELSTVVDDGWAQRLWEWADRNGIPNGEWYPNEEFADGGYYDSILIPTILRTVLTR